MLLIGVCCVYLQMEVDDPSNLTEQYIYDEVHPVKNAARQMFAKPKGPAGRGPRRVTQAS